MVPRPRGGVAPFIDIARQGLGFKASLMRLGIEFGEVAALVPAGVRRRLRLYLDREVDVVLDAAGFAYSDQWGMDPMLELARATRRCRRRGTRVVLLPQAFGPFAAPEGREAIRRAVADCTLVMPRDTSSHRHLIEVTGKQGRIRPYPDFTNLIEGVVPPWFDADSHRVAIVPNCRMLDRTDADMGAAYLPLMVRCAKHLVARNARPFVLVHEGRKDERIAEHIAASSGGIPIIKETNPLLIKGILGASRGVVASRYHALVSALSQAVPALGTSWSHKYAELFADYGIQDGLLPISADAKVAEAMLDRLLDNASNLEIAAGLRQEATRLKQLSEAMWLTVQSVIDGSPTS
jgi:colanic acid/amylovoran biosynthesis protein